MNHANTKERFLSHTNFAELLNALIDLGYEIIGPTIAEEAIVYDAISSPDDLPRGWTDEQSPGKYRLKKRDDHALFGYVVGPHSWKRFLFPPHVRLEGATLSSEGWQFQDIQEDPRRYAFLGVRACELAAIGVQDRVFLSGPYIDPIYQQRRENSLVIAVNCTQAAPTCFCSSMNTGPACKSGFDLALTEVDGGFVVEVASNVGEQVLNSLPVEEASIHHLLAAQEAREQAVVQIEKQLDTTDLRDLLASNLEHPRWDEVAERCLSCTNCTMVCPTCFCTSVEEISDLTGDNVERHRHWDSCFNVDFSYMNGGNVRHNVRSRYRQWLTHKLAFWNDQFGESGCVGCGRCITWCPVGIDLTEEVAAIRESDQ